MEGLQIEIVKSERKLSVFEGADLVASFEVAFGFEPIGPKAMSSDGRTPEGEYLVCAKNPESKFHLSLALNYPNEWDAKRGLESGLITEAQHDAILEANKNGKLPPQDTALGGEIYIHGGGIEGDWTRGCIGLADNEMTELFEAVGLGTPVTIYS
ncbi:MAG: L,D-transpeptidase family protein [Candidatus Binatia bacterium]